MMNLSDLKTRLEKEWGGDLDFPLNQPINQKPLISKIVKIEECDNEARAWLACQYIRWFSPGCGSYAGTNEPSILLNLTAADIRKSEHSIASRRWPHIAYALETIANNPPFDSPTVVATPFMMSQLEYFFRRCSEELDDAGRVLMEIGSPRYKTTKLLYRVENTVSNIEDTYKIFKNSLKRPKCFDYLTQLDDLLPYEGFNGKESKIDSAGARLKFMRDPSAHGYWADSSSDSYYICLMFVMVFYTDLKPFLDRGQS